MEIYGRKWTVKSENFVQILERSIRKVKITQTYIK